MKRSEVINQTNTNVKESELLTHEVGMFYEESKVDPGELVAGMMAVLMIIGMVLLVVSMFPPTPKQAVAQNARQSAGLAANKK